jgi:hypothetical protein
MLFTPNPKWAIGYLDGRAKGFVAGHLPFAALTSAVDLAHRHGVPSDAIRAVLREHALPSNDSDHPARGRSGKAGDHVTAMR